MKRPEVSTLYHYSCHHGARGIGERGLVLPTSLHSPEAVERMPDNLRWLCDYAWFTDLADPAPQSLGLTRVTIDCDRMAHRFQVKAADLDSITWWPDEMRDLKLAAARRISLVPGAMPAHWWVAKGPIHAVGAPWVDAG